MTVSTVIAITIPMKTGPREILGMKDRAVASPCGPSG